MADLQEMEPLLGQLFSLYNLARNETDAAHIHLSAATWYPTTLAQVYATIPHICKCLDDLVDAVYALTGLDIGIYQTWFCMTDCFERLVADTGPVTWQSIIQAWVTMNAAETMFTVDFIDQMRFSIWNESYLLKLQANPYT